MSPSRALARPRRGAAAAGMIGLIRIYQRSLGAWKGPTCRFLPTCSEYAIHAIEDRGPLLGPLLGLWRILRCHPFSRGGYDPAPLTREAEERAGASARARPG